MLLVLYLQFCNGNYSQHPHFYILVIHLIMVDKLTLNSFEIEGQFASSRLAARALTPNPLCLALLHIANVSTNPHELLQLMNPYLSDCSEWNSNTNFLAKECMATLQHQADENKLSYSNHTSASTCHQADESKIYYSK
jgi:hypothetical protein